MIDRFHTCPNTFGQGRRIWNLRAHVCISEQLRRLQVIGYTKPAPRVMVPKHLPP